MLVTEQLELSCLPHTEKAKKEALGSIEAVTGTLLDSVNRGVAQVYLNQQRLESESKTLQTQTARFAK